jgi:hypothetical protein
VTATCSRAEPPLADAELARDSNDTTSTAETQNSFGIDGLYRFAATDLPLRLRIYVAPNLD